jgi:integral membrane protein
VPAEQNLTRPDTTRTLTPRVAGALQRYRIAAFVVGVGLLILCATMVLKYGFDLGWAVQIWGPIHGVLYAAYVLLAFDLSYKARWSLWGLLKVLLAGVVPVLSFYCERWVHRKMLSGQRI